MSADENFNPHSHNAMFATILAEIKGQKDVMDKVLVQTQLTNGRVTKLEKVNVYRAGWIAGVGALGGLVGSVLGFLFN
jgi:hypothetical protein